MLQGRRKFPLGALLAGLAAATMTTPIAAQDLVGDCGPLPDRLAACEPFTCTFTHPFTGGSETREVRGPDGDNCLYHESMPNKGSMDCTWDEATRARMADFYRESFAGGAPSAGNPLNDALADGTCKVSGY